MGRVAAHTLVRESGGSHRDNQERKKWQSERAAITEDETPSVAVAIRVTKILIGGCYSRELLARWFQILSVLMRWLSLSAARPPSGRFLAPLTILTGTAGQITIVQCLEHVIVWHQRLRGKVPRDAQLSLRARE